jgi:glycosyltransferase involved in cell wall biosynthesis
MTVNAQSASKQSTGTALGEISWTAIPPAELAGRMHDDQHLAGHDRGTANADVSVVIATYNCADLLERAVRSASCLAGARCQIVIVDDGSTDHTGDVIARLQGNLPRLRVISQPNRGLSSARNAGIREASGRYILLLDADDELLPMDLGAALATEADLIRIGVRDVRLEESAVDFTDCSPPMSGAEYLKARFEDGTFYTASVAYVYRRQFLLETGLRFEPGLYHEDMLFSVKALLAARSVVCLPGVAYRYIRRPGSITMKKTDDLRAARIASLARIAKELVNMANARPEVDLRYWITRVLDYAHDIALRSRLRSAKLRVLLTQIRYVLTYRGYGGRPMRYEERVRLRKSLDALRKNTTLESESL